VELDQACEGVLRSTRYSNLFITYLRNPYNSIKITSSFWVLFGTPLLLITPFKSLQMACVPKQCRSRSKRSSRTPPTLSNHGITLISISNSASPACSETELTKITQGYLMGHAMHRSFGVSAHGALAYQRNIAFRTPVSRTDCTETQTDGRRQIFR
jgi:hypothetical protein